ncbi:MAG TPA: nicotinate-nucleotide adenylyltransferase [Ktedonobacterales bacterium]|nr:nicotinate-nucleotide adenylyltransferase [Ktedonobacterales bacterium]
MRAGARYGILGGTFDPPHIGHLALAQEAAVRLGLDRVWFLPAADPPHKRGRELSDARDRAAMVELAIAGDERFGLDRADLDRSGPSYTVDTLDILRARWGPEVWIGFIIGWDMLLYLPEWHDPAGVLARLDALIVARRPGALDEAEDTITQLEAALPGLRERLALLDAPQLEISSTWLRERVRLELPVRYLTPDPVRTYISQRGLYRSNQGSGASGLWTPEEGSEP